MADDSVPIFSRVEATLSRTWIRNDGSNVTDLLNRIESEAKGNIEIRFRHGKYVLCGSLFHINAVHELLSRRDTYPHLELDFTDESLVCMSGPPSFIYPNSNHKALYVHSESNIEESDLEFVTTYTDGKAGGQQEKCSRQSENLVLDASEKSEAIQRSASTESSNVEAYDRSADTSDTFGGGCNKKEEISNVKTTDNSTLNCTTASDTDKHDKICNADTNDNSAGTSDSYAGHVDERDKRGTGDDGDQTIDASSCSIVEENRTAAFEPNEAQQNEIVSNEIMVDADIWDYMQGIKTDQLREVLAPFRAVYQSEWDSTDEVYRVRLVFHQPTTENSQELIALACERFDHLYKETFDSCDVEPIERKSFVGNFSVKDVHTKFPSILLKPTDENVLFIGPHDDVQKAKKFLASKSKKRGRMCQSFSASSSRSCVDLTQRGESREDRTCQSATFAANDSINSSEAAEESLKDKVEECRKSESLTTDEAEPKDEKLSNLLVNAEESDSSCHDGRGDGSTATGFEHLDNDDHPEKNSSSDSFSILQNSRNSSFDDGIEMTANHDNNSHL